MKRFPAFLNAGTVRFVYARCGVNALSGLQILQIQQIANPL
ncbi:hypothetical protein EC2848050_5011 [Escherichia coli 2848050]|nr:hypothetical protein EC2848050_5011 [Escherichia coli 2848050]